MDVRSRHRALFGRGEGTERIQFFSDAVFAIAMTLLVLEIRLPESADDDLTGALLELWPYYFAYVLSFVIVAFNWITHHRKFRVITRYDERLIVINLVLLLVVAFVPFPTSVIAEYGNETGAVVLYAATMAALTLVQLWLWVHAYRAKLMEPTVDRALFLYTVAHLIPAPAVFLVSIPLAIWVPSWTPFFWILIWPVGRIVSVLVHPRLDRLGAAPATPRRSRG